MNNNKTNTSTNRTGPRPTPRPLTPRHLESVDTQVAKARTERTLQRVARVAAIGLAGITSIALGNQALEAGKDYVGDRTEKAANAAPKAGEICVIDAIGGSPDTISTLKFADGYVDGEKVGQASLDTVAVMQEHPGEGVGICRDPNSDSLNNNHIVAPGTVSQDQLVTHEEFAKAGGISENVGMGK